jgi:hypothetical protein
MSTSTFKTDALNSHSLARKPLDSTLASNPADPNAKLDKAHEAWNARIDKDVKACVTGLEGLTTAADVCDFDARNLHSQSRFRSSFISGEFTFGT